MNICNPKAPNLPLLPVMDLFRPQIGAARTIAEAGVEVTGHLIAAQAALQAEMLRRVSTGQPESGTENIALRQAGDHMSHAIRAGFSLQERLQAYWLQAFGAAH